MIKSKLFNSIVNGIDSLQFKYPDVSRYDINNINIDSIDADDMKLISKHIGINYDEYVLFLQFVNKQKVEYNRKNINTILNSKRLIAYALNDKNATDDIKNILLNYFDKSDEHHFNNVTYDIKLELPSFTEFKEGDYFNEFESEEIDNTKQFYEEKNLLYQKANTHQLKSYNDMIDALRICRKTNDAEYKKAIFKEISDNIISGSNIAYDIYLALRYEKNKDVLNFVFENCTKLLLLTECTWMEGYKASVIYRMQDHPYIDEKMAQYLIDEIGYTQNYLNNKMNAAIGVIVARCGCFTDKEYEYFCGYHLYDRISYKTDVNCATIVEAIAKSPKTPIKHLDTLKESQNSNIKLMALVATAIKTMVSDVEFTKIMDAVDKRQFETIFLLNNDIKASIYKNIVSNMKKELKEYDYLDKRDRLLSALRMENKEITKFNSNYISDIKTKFGYISSDDYEFLSIVEQKLLTSNEYKYIKAEREYIKENAENKSAQTQQTNSVKSQNQSEQTLIEEILSDKPQWINIISDITDEEIEI